MSKLQKGTINLEEYQERVKGTIEKISELNRSELASCVIHRRIILDLFRNGLNIKEDGKFQLESYLHQLIYPMRTTSEDMPYENHNLWLIDEKCKDILLLDQPVVLAECSSNGLAFDSVVIFELKRHMRDDYNMEENPVNQLQDYVEKIRKGKVKDSRHRPIRVTDTTQFYLCAVCDITPSLERILQKMDFTQTPDNMGAYGYNKLLNDAEKRNKVLFTKLGL